jgi:hypothetical protein
MNRMRRCLLAGLVAVVSMGSVCEDDEPITGTYRLNIIESQDTCDQDLDEFGSIVTIRLGETGYVIEFGEEGTLTGDFNDEGVLVAQGNILVVREGQQIVGSMAIQIVIRQGQITDGSGRLTFNGTFPGKEGVTCIQEFTITGRRTGSSVAPLVG